MGWPKVHALIPAAGQSVRFGGTTLKQYAGVIGMPVMALSIAAVKRHPAVASVTVVLARDDGIYKDLVAPQYPDVQTTIGGSSRAESVHNGLQHLLKAYPDGEWVLIHDAARPCLSAQSLADLFDLTFDDGAHDSPGQGGAILAVPVSDTIKRAIEPPVDLARYRNQGRVQGAAQGRDRRRDQESVEQKSHQPTGPAVIECTVERHRLWAAQTPQLFPLHLLAKNVADMIHSGIRYTDEASVMEAAGYHPRLVPGSTSNIKITGAKDLQLAEAIMSTRNDSVNGLQMRHRGF